MIPAASASVSRSTSAPRYGSVSVTAATSSTSSRSEPDERVFVPAGPPDRWVFAMPWDSPPEPSSRSRPTRLRTWSSTASGARELPIEIERAMHVSYGLPGRAVPRRRRIPHRDAAHRVTPRGATGLNTAIRDGFDIGGNWGGSCAAGPTLTCSRVTSASGAPWPSSTPSARASPTARSSATVSASSADIGGRIAHVWVPRDARCLSLPRPPRRRADATSSALTGTAPRRATIRPHRRSRWSG